MHLSLKNSTGRNQESQTFHELDTKQKLQYIWDYHKLPIVITCIVLYIAGYALYTHYTQKNPVLSAALVNFAPSEQLSDRLGKGFIDAEGLDSRKNEVRLYTGLYLTDDENDPNHAYTYASRMKILGAIDSEALDIVLMNKEAFDAFSQNGYLCNLKNLLLQADPALYEELAPFLQTNTVILEDNALDLYFDDTVTYSAKTEEYPMGIDLTQFPCIRDAGLNGTIYLGVITNSPHLSEAVSYIDYLWNESDLPSRIQKSS